MVISNAYATIDDGDLWMRVKLVITCALAAEGLAVAARSLSGVTVVFVISCLGGLFSGQFGDHIATKLASGLIARRAIRGLAWTGAQQVRLCRPAESLPAESL
jgi:hypothetical protein